MIRGRINQKAAIICGLLLHEIGNKNLVLGMCIIWDIYAQTVHGSWCRERLRNALGDRFHWSICATGGGWFIWSEDAQDHVGGIMHQDPIDALASAVELAELPA